MPQDFSGQNLRGRSFKGQNLEGANFSYADIRSTDFTGANLKNAHFSKADIRGAKFINAILIGADFSDATAGQKKYWVIFVIIVSFLLFWLSGFSYSLVGQLVALNFRIDFLENTAFNWLAILIIIPFFIITTRQIVILILGIIFIIAAPLGIVKILQSFNITNPALDVFVGVIVAVIAFLCVVEIIIVIMQIPIINTYIGWHTWLINKKNNLVQDRIYSFAIAFATTGGTSFRFANLTDAKFIRAKLKATDFRDATLTQTDFFHAKMLYYIRPGKTYLQNIKLCEVLVTRLGKGKKFDHQYLREVNFQKADLKDASFIGTDLSGANLQDADLSRAKLVQTQLNGTDLTGATLTGAYIQDWGITTDTKFDGVRCEYVYMRLPTKENPDPLRKPDNNKEVFADGEFGDFIKPIFDTLDLYHNQGVDPRAIAISFKQLAENHPEADLRIVGMEVRGEDKLLLRAKTAATADKSQLSAEYVATYNEIKGLPEREIKLLLAEKDNQIRRLENMVMTALERPSFYSNTQIEKVNTMTNNPGGISQNVSGGNVYGGMQASQGNNNVQTSTTYSSSEQKQNLAEAATEIQALLEQLSQSYPTNTNSEKMVFAIEAKKHVENNPTLMKKIISALEAGSTAALEQLLSHPAASFVIGAFEDFKNNSK
ncbi:pentapeptide repeat-containing protein [Nostoc parmelioides]|uniref:Pentapeptide repeat-containing protein n=1 Tax=Nostoc parmelioides FACHB-3921 TaxID=2692909 RepID=A0ABR8BKX2_9NOSO|nr:pentapeptide repeat-containing protein [Nostoc parmelioides]MBD2254758.1 pentapeptide repeat-containing protein [Nostoc parmelioides FACHB-3921]